MRQFKLVIVVCVCAYAIDCLAQTQTTPPDHPAQTPPTTSSAQQDRIKVFTEEVLISVRVTNAHGRFDPSLEKDELLILEDGVPQEIMSLSQVPASVLLLISTAGELNPAMKTNLSKEIAAHFVSRLKTGDQISVLQYGRETDIVQDWTTDSTAALQAIRTKLSTRRGARLADALASSVPRFNGSPAGNRHLVLITDCYEDSDQAIDELPSTVTKLLTQGITVHVISYSQMGLSGIRKLAPLLTITGKKPRKTAADIVDEILNPITARSEKPKIYIIIDTDIQMRRKRARYSTAIIEGHRWLTVFAAETGGLMLTPASAEEMLLNAETVAGSIDSQYVATYRPKRTFAFAPKGEYRRIDVISRKIGLSVSSRRGYVVPASPGDK